MHYDSLYTNMPDTKPNNVLNITSIMVVIHEKTPPPKTAKIKIEKIAEKDL